MELSFSNRFMFSLSRASNNLMRNKVIVEIERAGLRGAVGQYIKLKSSVLVQDNESLANFACSSLQRNIGHQLFL